MAPTLGKSLARLSAASLIDLCLRWLDVRDPCCCTPPYLQSNRSADECDDEDYLFPPAASVAELRQIYGGLSERVAAAGDSDDKIKAHIIDRMLEGDWRRGLSLQQLAMIDFALLEQSDTALRWSALKLTRLANDEALPKGIEERDGSGAAATTKRRKLNNGGTTPHPSVQPSTFVAALKAHISPLVKAHYQLHRLGGARYNGLPVLRIYISSRAAFAPTAGSVPRQRRRRHAAPATDAGRVVYIALPESCPYVYVSVAAKTTLSADKDRDKAKASSASSTPMDMAALKRCILECIPKALSRPHERWALEPTRLTARSLHAICALRGSGRPGTAGGAYSRFASDTQGALASSHDGDQDRVTARFGAMGGGGGSSSSSSSSSQEQDQAAVQQQQHASLDRFHVRIDDLLRGRDGAGAPVDLAFAGADVFLGLKQLASLDDGRYVDLNKLPSWMTGEMGVSVMRV